MPFRSALQVFNALIQGSYMGYLLSNGVFRLSLQVEADPAGLVPRLMAFFTPYLMVDNSDAPADLTVCLHAPDRKSVV